MLNLSFSSLYHHFFTSIELSFFALNYLLENFENSISGTEVPSCSGTLPIINILFPGGLQQPRPIYDGLPVQMSAEERVDG